VFKIHIRINKPRKMLCQCDGIHIDGKVLGYKELCNFPEACGGGFAMNIYELGL